MFLEPARLSVFSPCRFLEFVDIRQFNYCYELCFSISFIHISESYNMNTQRKLLNKCALVKSINCVWGLHVAEGSGEQRLIDARVNFFIIMNAWGQLLNLTTPTRNICLIKLIFRWDAKILYRCQWMPGAATLSTSRSSSRH